MKSASAHLRELLGLKLDFRDAATARKIELLEALERGALPSTKAVKELHEALCFSRAYPESRAHLEAVERLLRGFDRRRDLRRWRRDLADTGIAGTELTFRFFWLMAERLARRWPEAIQIDWGSFDRKRKLEEILHLLFPFSESLAFDMVAQGARPWVEALKGPAETDAAFLIRRFAALRVPQAVKEKLYEDLDVPVRLSPGSTTPARGRERFDGAPVVLRREAPDRARPDLRRMVRTTRVRVRRATAAEARRLIDLANACMVTRHRDLLIFLHADARDVMVVDCGGGLQFACFGAAPERRLMLEAVYGFLTLRSGVPTGYVLNSALFGSAEIAYNVFETFRGVDAARVFGCVLAMVHRLFRVDTFALDPYQLGHRNDEGLRSGAWWFYYKLGFRPHDAAVRALVREERARLAEDPKHRTPRARLDALASEYMFLHLGRPRRDVLGHLDLGNIGLAISRFLAQRFGADREAGLAACAEEAAGLLGVRSLRSLSAGERVAWERWAPLALLLPGVGSWTPAQRRAFADVIRAKGGRREVDYVHRLDRHAKLRAALVRLARSG